MGQSDAAAAFDWLRIETERAYERPASEVTGNASDGGERRPPGVAGMVGSVRYQIYDAPDAPVIFMASERHFWQKFCDPVGRSDLFERFPGRVDRRSRARQRRAPDALVEISRRVRRPNGSSSVSSTTYRSLPVNTSKSLPADPQFIARLPWLREADLGADQCRFQPGSTAAWLRRGGVHRRRASTRSTLAAVLGLDESEIDELSSRRCLRSG